MKGLFMINAVGFDPTIGEIQQPQMRNRVQYVTQISHKGGSDFERTPDNDSFESSDKKDKTGKTVGIVAATLVTIAAVIGGICLHKGAKALKGEDATLGKKVKRGWEELWGKKKVKAEESKPENENKPKSDDPKPGDPKPGDPKPGEAKPEETKPGETKPGETKPGETKPGDPKPGDPKPGETKPGETKPGEKKPGEAKPEGAAKDNGAIKSGETLNADGNVKADSEIKGFAEEKPVLRDAENVIPNVETPKVATPKVETPKVEPPKAETPKVDTPKVEPPKAETPKVETPKVETPKAETPKVETPKVETPKAETPKVDTPKVETPKVDTPKANTPKVETPKVDAPMAETPTVETIVPQASTAPVVESVKPIASDAQPTAVRTVTKPETAVANASSEKSELKAIVKKLKDNPKSLSAAEEENLAKALKTLPASEKMETIKACLNSLKTKSLASKDYHSLVESLLDSGLSPNQFDDVAMEIINIAISHKDQRAISQALTMIRRIHPERVSKIYNLMLRNNVKLNNMGLRNLRQQSGIIDHFPRTEAEAYSYPVDLRSSAFDLYVANASKPELKALLSEGMKPQRAGMAAQMNVSEDAIVEKINKQLDSLTNTRRYHLRRDPKYMSSEFRPSLTHLRPAEQKHAATILGELSEAGIKAEINGNNIKLSFENTSDELLSELKSSFDEIKGLPERIREDAFKRLQTKIKELKIEGSVDTVKKFDSIGDDIQAYIHEEAEIAMKEAMADDVQYLKEMAIKELPSFEALSPSTQKKFLYMMQKKILQS